MLQWKIKLLKDTVFNFNFIVQSMISLNPPFLKVKCHLGWGGHKSDKNVSRIIWMAPYSRKIKMWFLIKRAILTKAYFFSLFFKFQFCNRAAAATWYKSMIILSWEQMLRLTSLHHFYTQRLLKGRDSNVLIIKVDQGPM